MTSLAEASVWSWPVLLGLVMEIAVLERTSEIALFNVMGVRRREISAMLDLEGGWLGIFGTTLLQG